ncbi:MAG: adenylate/guanylate cyclase domain-containing protein [Geminicoccaceae bacterium]
MGTTGAIEHAAILFADVKGYSVLISRDEVGTYERLRRARALFQALVGDYGGRIVDEAGDGVLAAFSSANDAVNFALAIQRDLANAAAWQGETGPFAFRMGIHQGPIHRDGERLYGKTLIVAQRIQEVAPPGRVCVSDAVRTELEDHALYRCVSLGDRMLKNLEPTRVHRVEWASELPEADLTRLAGETTSGAVEDASIAILPLRNHSDLQSDQTLCDGVTTDIIERLSRFRDLSVIARHSSFQCRTLALEPPELGQLLGVRYLAEGSLRRSGERLRVSAQLVETETGRTLWADRFDGTLADVFDFQDEVADMMAARLASHVNAAERRRIISSRAPEVAAYGLVLRGQDLTLRYRQETNSHARRLFEEAAGLDPIYARVYVGMSRTYSEAWRHGWEDQSESGLAHAATLAMKAVEQDDLDARGFAELGYVRFFQKQHQQALGAYKRATELNPNDADVLAEMSDVLSSIGDAASAVDLMKRAIRLNPCHPDWYLCNYADALFVLGEYAEVVATLLRMRDLTAGHRLLAASYALLGESAHAHIHAQAVRTAYPNFSLQHWRQVPPDPDSPWLEKYLEGLSLAGLD